MTISTIVPSQQSLKKWLNTIADALKRLSGKAVKALLASAESVFGVILSFLSKAVGFVSEHTWDLIVFVAGLTGVGLMQTDIRRHKAVITFFISPSVMKTTCFTHHLRSTTAFGLSGLT